MAFVDFWDSYNPKESLFYKLLEKHYKIDIVGKEDADYVFFSVWGNSHWFVPEHCVKIFWTGENRTPDFNACDYALGFERLQFRDRYMRFPLYYTYPECTLMEKKHCDITIENLKQEKNSFCSFTVSGTVQPSSRIKMYELLTNYKKVDSGGKFRNNIGGPVKDKFAFDSKHKFSICFENFSYDGYCTEKIVQAFAAKTIPIYWGDPKVTEVFNEDAFVCVHNFASFDDVLNRVKQIDNDDMLWLKMLQTPALLSEKNSYGFMINMLEDFLFHIFDQPQETAQRRTRWGKHTATVMQEMLKAYNLSKMSLPRRIYHMLMK